MAFLLDGRKEQIQGGECSGPRAWVDLVTMRDETIRCGTIYRKDAIKISSRRRDDLQVTMVTMSTPPKKQDFEATLPPV